VALQADRQQAENVVEVAVAGENGGICTESRRLGQECVKQVQVFLLNCRFGGIASCGLSEDRRILNLNKDRR